MIGWIDPYPNEIDPKSIKVPQNEDFVYDSRRFVNKKAPYVVYIPKKIIMFKMMRICIGV
jgi:hypothetical protein